MSPTIHDLRGPTTGVDGVRTEDEAHGYSVDRGMIDDEMFRPPPHTTPHRPDYHYFNAYILMIESLL